MELHERQQRILRVIEDAVKTQGYPPTVREIGAAVGLCFACVSAGPSQCSGGHGIHPSRESKRRALEVVRP